MPTTVNGIGTHYYGTKNLMVRTAVCGSCRRLGNLTSYDTRLWFVVIFIPIIPLGRKRIIDRCPSCTRHRVADADAFEQAKQLQISAGLDLFRREPSPDAALNLHGQLLAFHEHDQAAEFRRTAMERFPSHAGLRVGVAAQLDQVSAYDDAAGLYESALALEPDLPAAREGVAVWKMASGELDEARHLLDFMEAPGAGSQHNLHPLDVLAGYYQRAGRHHETLELATHLLREWPEAGRQHKFRAFVRRSEKALGFGVAESILPARQHSLRGLFRAEGSEYPAWQRRVVLASLVLALLTSGLAASNEYIRRNRSLNVVNACGLPVQVSVDGDPAKTVGDFGTVVVSEGRHRLRVTGPVDQTVDVDLSAGYFDRWFKKPLWVLNAGGEAVLEERTVYYAENPRPSTRRLVAGAPFTALSHVDYRFESPPQSMKLETRNAEVVKSVLEWKQGEDADAFLEALAGDRASAQTFAERRLRREPVQNELLRFYAGTAKPDEYPRLEAFLKSGLGRRPAWVEWHRTYQYFASRCGHEDELIPYYDDLIAKEPKSGRLLYLRCRIEADPGREESLLRRSIEVDPAQPWAYFARARHLASEERWDESLKDYQKARELQVDADLLAEEVHTVRLARGEAKALIAEYKTRLAAAPTELGTVLLLCDALAVAGQADQIEPEITAWVNRLGMPYEAQVAGPVRAAGLYQAGKLEECERLGSQPGSQGGGLLQAQTLLALGRPKDVIDNQAFANLWDNPWNSLALSLALSLDGRSKDADEWRERAAHALESQGVDNRRAAVALRAAEPVSVADLVRVVVDADEKALLCAALGARFPEKQAEYAAIARRFNLRRKAPYRLILRATDGPTP